MTMLQLIDNLTFNFVIIELDKPDDLTALHPRIKQVNLSAAVLLGYDENELIDKPLAAIYADESEEALWRSAIVAALDNNADNNSSKSFEGRIVSKQKHTIPVLISLSVLPAQCPGKTAIVLLIQDIRDRKQQDKELFLMHRAVEQSSSAVLITDRSGRIEYINPKYTELTGYSSKELLGQNPKIMQSGSTASEIYQNMWHELFKTGEWRGEIKNQKKNGEVYWVYESISAIKNNQGEITHFLAVEEDITRQKETASALTESEQRFSQMGTMIGEWLWEQSPDGYYSYSSIAVNEILGYSPDQVIGKHYTEFLTAQDKAIQQHYVTSRQPFYGLINHYRHKDGHAVFTESTGLPIINDEGDLLMWRGVDRDITAQKHYQDALIESEQRKRLIIESSLDAIIMMDTYGIITDWNHQAEKMFGWPRSEAIGQRLGELVIPARFRNTHWQGLQNFLHSGIGPILNRQIEHIGMRRDGSEFPVELYISPLKLGNAYVFSGFVHDITERKAAEQKIRQAQVNLAIARSEINIARQIQASLLPSAPLKSDHFEITGLCLPADQVGGDYFDYFFRNEDRLDMVIADVSGHSIGPALFMVEARSAIRTQANGSETPAQTLAVLNDFLFTDLNTSDYFITMFYLQYDLAGHLLRFANAGHPPPLLISSGHTVCRQLDADGLILGVREHVVFEEKTMALAKDDLILIYTDGLIEAENTQGEFFGVERVSNIFIQQAGQAPQQIIDTLLASLKEFCRRESFKDDITLMIFKRS